MSMYGQPPTRTLGMCGVVGCGKEATAIRLRCDDHPVTERSKLDAAESALATARDALGKCEKERHDYMVSDDDNAQQVTELHRALAKAEAERDKTQSLARGILEAHDAMHDALKRIRAERDAALADAERMRGALAFYADPSTYSKWDPRHPGKSFSRPIAWDVDERTQGGAIEFAGARARAAIAALDELGKEKNE